MSNIKLTKRVTPASCKTLLALLETLPDALFVVNDDATIVYANASAQAMTGATLEDIFGMSLWRGAPQLVSTSLYQAIQKTKQTREPTEVAYVSPVTNLQLHAALSPTDEGLAIFFQEQLELQEPQHLQHVVSRNEQMYRDLLEDLADAVTILTPDGLILDIDQCPQATAHLRREAAVGQPLTDLRAWSYDPAVQQQLRAAIARASNGETVRFEATIHPQTDQYLDIAMTITCHRDANQQVAYLICAERDITERKQAEENLRTLLDAIPHFVWTMRPDGSAEYANQHGCDYTGKTLEHIQEDGWLQLIHPDDRQRVQEALQSSIQTGVPYEVEHRIQHGSTGDYRWFLGSANPVRAGTGQVVKWLGTCTDIDEQKQAQERSKASELNWRVLTETMPQLVATTLPDGTMTYFNQRYYDYLGASLQHTLGAEWRQFLHPDDYERVQISRRHSLETGDPCELEYRLKESKTGTYRWFLGHANPVRDDTGQIVKWLGTCTDIDEQKQAQERSKASELNWRVLTETMPQLVWTSLPDGTVTYSNQRHYDYLGASPQHWLGAEWQQFLHPDDYERVQAYRHHTRETGDPSELEYRLKEGKTGVYRWFLARALPVRDETGQVVKWLGTRTDIDEWKRAEEALHESQELVRTLMDSSIIGITIAEGEEFVQANDTFLRMTGYSQEDLSQRRINWARMTPPEYVARTQQAHRELAIHHYMTPYEKEYVCKDGSLLPILTGGVTFSINPAQDVYFVLDNSARKELEQRKDDFINMASHELRNPLTALKMQTTLLHRQLAKQGIQPSAPALSRMETQINKITRLVEELLDVSKIQAGRLEYRQETVDLDELLREITDIFQHINPSHTIMVRGAVQTSLLADRDRLGQVFTNLISNAIKYSPDALTVEIDLDASPEMVTIRVHDHGLGIPREQLDKIFERFYRIPGPRQKAIPGLGMGLYIVSEIVKHHEGTISVDSEVGQGSTFTVTLPKQITTFA